MISRKLDGRMKINKILIPVLLLLNSLAYASDASKLIPVKVDNKWGYINASGKLLIPTSYDYAGQFDKYGFAIVKTGTKYGLINKYNKKIIKEEYDHIEVVDKNKLLVKKGRYYGVINLVKDTPIDILYDEISTFENGFLKIRKDSLYGIVDTEGKLVSDALFSDIKLVNNFFICSKEEKFGAFNLKGDEILEPIYADVVATNTVLFLIDEKGLWGGVNINGDNIIPKIYDQLQLITTNLVKTTQGNNYGLISASTGKQIFDSKLREVFSVSEDVVVANEAGYYTLHNAQGKRLTNKRYKDIKTLNSSLISVSTDGVKWGLVDDTGYEFLPESYEHVGFYDYNMLKLIKNGEVSKKGIPEKYFSKPEDEGVKVDNIDAYDMFNHDKLEVASEVDPALAKRFGWFQYGKQKLWGLRSKSGDVLIRPVFASIKIFEELSLTKVELPYPSNEIKENNYISKVDGEAKFSVKSKYGVFDHSKNKILIPVKYWSLNVEDFRKGEYARAIYEKGYFCLINKQAEIIFSKIIKDQFGKKVKKSISYVGDFVDGYAAINYDGKVNVTDEYTDNLIGPFSKVFSGTNTLINEPFKNVEVTGGHWGFIGRNGEEVIKPKFEKAADVLNGVFPVMSGGKWGFLNQQADTLLDFTYANLDLFDEDLGLFSTQNNSTAYAMADTNGNIISEAIYEAIYDFHEGYAKVRKDGKWTLINDRGEMVTRPMYDELKDFKEGLAPARIGRLWGYINKTGRLVIDPTFVDANSFSEGLAVVRDKSGYGYINTDGEFVVEPNLTLAEDFYNGVAVIKANSFYGIIDQEGRSIIKPKYGKIGSFDENGYAVVGKTARGGPYGLINNYGKQILPLKYEEIREVSEGLVAVKYKGYYGFADVEIGKVVIRPSFKNVHAFSEGIVGVYINGMWGYMDTEGVLVVDPVYKAVHDFHEGKAVVIDKKSNSFILEPSGELHPIKNIKEIHDFHEGVSVAKASNDTYFFMDKDGNHMFQGDYEYADDFIRGLAVVKIEGKYGLIDHNGNFILSPVYEKIIHLASGNSVVKIEKLSGLVSANGLEVLEPKYDKISKFDDEILRVEQAGKIGYANAVGDFFWTPKR